LQGGTKDISRSADKKFGGNFFSAAQPARQGKFFPRNEYNWLHAKPSPKNP
jgi:hypothetical protein